MAISASMVVMPGIEGHVGILPNHAPMIIELGKGVMEVFVEGRLHDRVFINGGFADIMPEGLAVLAEEATPLSTLDRSQLRDNIASMERTLQTSTVETVRETAESKLRDAQIMLLALEQGSVIQHP